MAKKTARACLLDKPNGDFFIGEYPIPEPGPGGLLMKIELCGVCGTDIHTWHAPAEAVFGCEYPVALGHEISGTVAALGDGVTADYIGQPLKVGDRIGVCPAIHCHKCYFCTIAKTPEKCTDWKTYGTWPKADQRPHFGGGYADYLYIHDPNSVVIKSTTSPERTAFLEPMAVIDHAMLHAQIKHGDTVVIQGSGPIGLLATACAKVGGAAKVITTDKYNRKRLELAKEMGADLTLCHLDVESEKGRKEFIFDNSLNLVGADVVINCVGHPAAFKECLNFVRDSGRLIEVGNFVDRGTIEFNPCRDLLEKGITLIGSFDNEAEHYVRSMPLISDERIRLEKLITHTVPLGELQNVLSSIENQEKIDGKEAVKVMIDPTMPERN